MRTSVLTIVAVAACLGAASARASGAGERAFFHGAYARSAILLQAEAAAGRPFAETLLGYSYQYGLGVPQSYEEAARWYRCAAEQGEVHAQFYLGLLYDRGLGAPEDPVEAEKWLDLAAARAPADLRDYWSTMRNEIAGKMTLDEVTVAQRLAVVWTPSYVCLAGAGSEAAGLRLPTHKDRRSEADRER